MRYPAQSTEAAREGLQLCANVILPSLFPFFVLSNLVVELGFARCLGRAAEGLMWPLFRVGGAGASALVLGFVGGYPVGARTAVRLYETGQLSKPEVQRLLTFCNNSGPAFILGVVGAGVFGSGRMGLLLYLVHAAASLCVGLIARFFGPRIPRPPRQDTPTIQTVRFSAAFTDSIKTAFSSVLNICAFVIFFAVILRLLSLCGVMDAIVSLLSIPPLPFDPSAARQLLTGLMELSSGVTSLAGGSAEQTLPLAAFMLGWAGLCVHCQVSSFLSDSGLSALPYLLGKTLHGLLSALFVCLFTRISQPVSSCPAVRAEVLTRPEIYGIFTAAWPVWLAFLLLSAFIRKKRGGKSVSHGV